MRGHTKDVCTLQFDETKIVSGSKDGTIKVHRIHLYFDGTPQTHVAVVVVVQLWDIRSQQCENTFIEHTDGVWAIQYEDNELVSASRGTPLHLPVLLHIQAELTPLARCSRHVADVDTTVKVWDMRAGRSRMTLRGARFYPCGLRSGAPSSPSWWLIGEFPIGRAGHTDKVLSMMFDESKIVTGAEDFTIRVLPPVPTHLWPTLCSQQSLIGVCCSSPRAGMGQAHGRCLRRAADWPQGCAPRSSFHCASEMCWAWSVADELVGSAGKVWTLKFHDAVMVSGSHDMTIRITRFDKKPMPPAAYAVKK